MSAAPVIEVRGVTKAYGEREVLRGIDLTVGEHRAVALIGASGSGKSTLLRCIDLLEDIDDGDVFLDGEVITDPSCSTVAVRRRLGVVFQAFNLFPHLTVLQNVVLAPGPRARRAARRGRGGGARAAGALRAGRPRRRLSGSASPAASSSGWRSCGRWRPSPRALLLDEVTSALDPELVGEVLALVRGLKQEGMTMVIATHEMAFAREVADEVCFLHEGRILERGDPERMFREPEQPETRRFLRRVVAAGRI